MLARSLFVAALMLASAVSGNLIQALAFAGFVSALVRNVQIPKWTVILIAVFAALQFIFGVVTIGLYENGHLTTSTTVPVTTTSTAAPAPAPTTTTTTLTTAATTAATPTTAAPPTATTTSDKSMIQWFSLAGIPMEAGLPAAIGATSAQFLLFLVSVLGRDSISHRTRRLKYKENLNILWVVLGVFSCFCAAFSAPSLLINASFFLFAIVQSLQLSFIVSDQAFALVTGIVAWFGTFVMVALCVFQNVYVRKHMNPPQWLGVPVWLTHNDVELVKNWVQAFAMIFATLIAAHVRGISYKWDAPLRSQGNRLNYHDSDPDEDENHHDESEEKKKKKKQQQQQQKEDGEIIRSAFIVGGSSSEKQEGGGGDDNNNNNKSSGVNASSAAAAAAGGDGGSEGGRGGRKTGGSTLSTSLLDGYASGQGSDGNNNKSKAPNQQQQAAAAAAAEGADDSKFDQVEEYVTGKVEWVVEGIHRGFRYVKYLLFVMPTAPYIAASLTLLYYPSAVSLLAIPVNLCSLLSSPKYVTLVMSVMLVIYTLAFCFQVYVGSMANRTDANAQIVNGTSTANHIVPHLVLDTFLFQDGVGARQVEMLINGFNFMLLCVALRERTHAVSTIVLSAPKPAMPVLAARDIIGARRFDVVEEFVYRVVGASSGSSAIDPVPIRDYVLAQCATFAGNPVAALVMWLRVVVAKYNYFLSIIVGFIAATTVHHLDVLHSGLVLITLVFAAIPESWSKVAWAVFVVYVCCLTTVRVACRFLTRFQLYNDDSELAPGFTFVTLGLSNHVDAGDVISLLVAAFVTSAQVFVNYNEELRSNEIIVSETFMLYEWGRFADHEIVRVWRSRITLLIAGIVFLGVPILTERSLMALVFLLVFYSIAVLTAYGVAPWVELLTWRLTMIYSAIAVLTVMAYQFVSVSDKLDSRFNSTFPQCNDIKNPTCLEQIGLFEGQTIVLATVLPWVIALLAATAHADELVGQVKKVQEARDLEDEKENKNNQDDQGKDGDDDNNNNKQKKKVKDKKNKSKESEKKSKQQQQEEEGEDEEEEEEEEECEEKNTGEEQEEGSSPLVKNPTVIAVGGIFIPIDSQDGGDDSLATLQRKQEADALKKKTKRKKKKSTNSNNNNNNKPSASAAASAAAGGGGGGGNSDSSSGSADTRPLINRKGNVQERSSGGSNNTTATTTGAAEAEKNKKKLLEEEGGDDDQKEKKVFYEKRVVRGDYDYDVGVGEPASPASPTVAVKREKTKGLFSADASGGAAARKGRDRALEAFPYMDQSALFGLTWFLDQIDRGAQILGTIYREYSRSLAAFSCILVLATDATLLGLVFGLFVLFGINGKIPMIYCILRTIATYLYQFDFIPSDPVLVNNVSIVQLCGLSKGQGFQGSAGNNSRLVIVAFFAHLIYDAMDKFPTLYLRLMAFIQKINRTIATECAYELCVFTFLMVLAYSANWIGGWITLFLLVYIGVVTSRESFLVSQWSIRVLRSITIIFLMGVHLIGVLGTRNVVEVGRWTTYFGFNFEKDTIITAGVAAIGLFCISANRELLEKRLADLREYRQDFDTFDEWLESQPYEIETPASLMTLPRFQFDRVLPSFRDLMKRSVLEKKQEHDEEEEENKKKKKMRKKKVKKPKATGGDADSDSESSSDEYETDSNEEESDDDDENNNNKKKKKKEQEGENDSSSASSKKTKSSLLGKKPRSSNFLDRSPEANASMVAELEEAKGSEEDDDGDSAPHLASIHPAMMTTMALDQREIEFKPEATFADFEEDGGSASAADANDNNNSKKKKKKSSNNKQNKKQSEIQKEYERDQEIGEKGVIEHSEKTRKVGAKNNNGLDTEVHNESSVAATIFAEEEEEEAKKGDHPHNNNEDDDDDDGDEEGDNHQNRLQNKYLEGSAAKQSTLTKLVQVIRDDIIYITTRGSALLTFSMGQVALCGFVCLIFSLTGLSFLHLIFVLVGGLMVTFNDTLNVIGHKRWHKFSLAMFLVLPIYCLVAHIPDVASWLTENSRFSRPIGLEDEGIPRAFGSTMIALLFFVTLEKRFLGSFARAQFLRDEYRAQHKRRRRHLKLLADARARMTSQWKQIYKLESRAQKMLGRIRVNSNSAAVTSGTVGDVSSAQQAAMAKIFRTQDKREKRRKAAENASADALAAAAGGLSSGGGVVNASSAAAAAAGGKNHNVLANIENNNKKNASPTSASASPTSATAAAASSGSPEIPLDGSALLYNTFNHIPGSQASFDKKHDISVAKEVSPQDVNMIDKVQREAKLNLNTASDPADVASLAFVMSAAGYGDNVDDSDDDGGGKGGALHRYFLDCIPPELPSDTDWKAYLYREVLVYVEKFNEFCIRHSYRPLDNGLKFTSMKRWERTLKSISVLLQARTFDFCTFSVFMNALLSGSVADCLLLMFWFLICATVYPRPPLQWLQYCQVYVLFVIGLKLFTICISTMAGASPAVMRILSAFFVQITEESLTAGTYADVSDLVWDFIVFACLVMRAQITLHNGVYVAVSEEQHRNIIAIGAFNEQLEIERKKRLAAAAAAGGGGGGNNNNDDDGENEGEANDYNLVGVAIGHSSSSSGGASFKKKTGADIFDSSVDKSADYLGKTQQIIADSKARAKRLMQDSNNDIEQLAASFNASFNASGSMRIVNNNNNSSSPKLVGKQGGNSSSTSAFPGGFDDASFSSSSPTSSPREKKKKKKKEYKTEEEKKAAEERKKKRKHDRLNKSPSSNNNKEKDNSDDDSYDDDDSDDKKEEEEEEEGEPFSEKLFRFWKQYYSCQKGVGSDTYLISVLFLAAAFFTFVMGYYEIAQIGSGSLLTAVQSDLLPGTLVVVIVTIVLAMIVDRAAYLLVNVYFKVVVHILFTLGSIIGYIIYRDLHRNAGFSGYAFFFFLWMYIWVSCGQIKAGFPRQRRHDPFTKYPESIPRWVCYMVYRAIPFLWEIRTCIDWTFTDTSLSFEEWFKVEDVLSMVYNRRVELNWRRTRLGNPADVQEKLVGLLKIVFIVIVLLFPLMVFSTFNPNTVANYVTETKLSLQFGQISPVYASGTFTSTTPKASKIPTYINSVYPGFGKFLTGGARKTFQLLDYTRCSSELWSISPQGLANLKQTLLTVVNTSSTIPLAITLTATRKETSGTTPLQILVPQARDLGPATAQLMLNALNNESAALSVPIADMYLPFFFNQPTGIVEWTQHQLSCSLTLRTPTPNPILNTSVRYWCVECDSLFSKGNAPNSSYPEWKCLTTGLNCGPFNYESLLPGKYAMGNHSKVAPYLLFASDDVARSFSFLAGLGIIAIYTTFVLAVGNALRAFFGNTAHYTVLTDMAHPLHVQTLLQYIELARFANPPDLVTEHKVYLQMMDLLRSPETLLRFTGRHLKLFKSDNSQRSQAAFTAALPDDGTQLESDQEETAEEAHASWDADFKAPAPPVRIDPEEPPQQLRPIRHNEEKQEEEL